MTLPIPANLWVLGSVARLVGVEDPTRILREFRQLVDTDALRHAGTEVWGTTVADSPTSGKLDGTADQLVDGFLRTVENRWQGGTYQAFENYLTEVRSALHQEADSLPIVGAALVAVADGIELTWLEMIGAALTAVGLLLAGGSFFGAGSLIMALLGLLVAALSGLVTFLSLRIPRVELLAKHETTLDRYDMNHSSPVDALPSIPRLPDGWTPKTADPYT